MKKGKSTYQFPINVDPNLAQQVIICLLYTSDAADD